VLLARNCEELKQQFRIDLKYDLYSDLIEWYNICCKGFGHSIARQRLGKHVPTHAAHNNKVEVSSRWSAPHIISTVLCMVRAASI
jgi:hypothetical protein